MRRTKRTKKEMRDMIINIYRGIGAFLFFAAMIVAASGENISKYFGGSDKSLVVYMIIAVILMVTGAFILKDADATAKKYN